MRTSAPIGENTFGFKIGEPPKYLNAKLRGTAYFKVKKSGDYLFELVVNTLAVTTARIVCTAGLQVEDQPIISAFDTRNENSATGQASLMEGTYAIGHL